MLPMRGGPATAHACAIRSTLEELPMRDNVKTYADHGYRFPTMVRHDGKVIALAMDEHRRIRYTVLDLAATMAANPLDAAGWSANPIELAFADELAHVGYGVADQTRLPIVKLGATSPVPAGGGRRDAAKSPLFLSPPPPPPP